MYTTRPGFKEGPSPTPLLSYIFYKVKKKYFWLYSLLDLTSYEYYSIVTTYPVLTASQRRIRGWLAQKFAFQIFPTLIFWHLRASLLKVEYLPKFWIRKYMNQKFWCYPVPVSPRNNVPCLLVIVVMWPLKATHSSCYSFLPAEVWVNPDRERKKIPTPPHRDLNSSHLVTWCKDDLLDNGDAHQSSPSTSR